MRYTEKQLKREAATAKAEIRGMFKANKIRKGRIGEWVIFANNDGALVLSVPYFTPRAYGEGEFASCWNVAL
jgi:hypothetical protein